MKSKGGYILLWVLLVYSFFLSWLSFTLKEISESIVVKRNILVLEERLKADRLMIEHFETSTSDFEYNGKYVKYSAIKADKKISVNVVGTTNLNYVYVIIEDGSLVLETMEE